MDHSDCICPQFPVKWIKKVGLVHKNYPVLFCFNHTGSCGAREIIAAVLTKKTFSEGVTSGVAGGWGVSGPYYLLTFPKMIEDIFFVKNIKAPVKTDFNLLITHLKLFRFMPFFCAPILNTNYYFFEKVVFIAFFPKKGYFPFWIESQ